MNNNNNKKMESLINNLVLDSKGKVNVKKTLITSGLCISATNIGKLNAILDKMNIQRNARKTKNNSVPAIYELVCSGSGKKYIGSSLRPDLRHLVHKFWLNNWFKFGSSNIFFGHDVFIQDIEKYGVGSFQFNIISSHPEITSLELKKLEAEYISGFDKEDLYNINLNGHYRTDIVFGMEGVNEEFKKMKDEINELCETRKQLYTDKTEFTKEYSKLRADESVIQTKSLYVAAIDQLSGLIKKKKVIMKEKLESLQKYYSMVIQKPDSLLFGE